MFAVFEKEKGITILMFAFIVLSVFTRIMIGILYQNMIREAENMSTTANRALKQCRTKFTGCYRLNGGVANVPIFVDKFLDRMRIGPFSFRTLYHLSGQMMMLAVFFAGLGVCRGILAGYGTVAVLPFYIVSFLALYLYFAVSAVADIRGRRQILKTSLVDYLENHQIPRLMNAEVDEARLEGERPQKRETLPESAGQNRASGERERRKFIAEEREGKKRAVFSQKEQRELEELLKEFLTS